MARAAEIGSSAASAGLGRRGGVGVGAGLLRAAPGQAARAEGDARERQDRHAGHQGDDAGRRRDHAQATGFIASWVTRALSAEPSTPALETRKPAAIEMTSAGTWLTRPSPMVMMV